MKPVTCLCVVLYIFVSLSLSVILTRLLCRHDHSCLTVNVMFETKTFVLFFITHFLQHPSPSNRVGYKYCLLFNQPSSAPLFSHRVEPSTISPDSLRSFFCLMPMLSTLVGHPCSATCLWLCQWKDRPSWQPDPPQCCPQEDGAALCPISLPD